MKKKILILTANAREYINLCELLNRHHYLTVPTDSIPVLEINLKGGDCTAAIMDLDSIPIDNRILKALSLKHSAVHFLCISTKRFHPELQDAIRHYIYACLNKPVDPDELLYWLRSMEGNNATAEQHVET